MSILFRTQGIYLSGTIGDTRYFNSASALAKSIEVGYIKPSIEGKGYDIRYEVKVFSDIPAELEKFNHEAFYAIIEKNENGFVFREKNPAGKAIWDPTPRTPEEEAELKAWQKRNTKASKAYRDQLAQAIESCYP